MNIAVARVECVNCSDGSDIGLILAGAAVLISATALVVAIFQTKLARTQTTLAKAQTQLTAEQTEQSSRQIAMAEKEHAVFMDELHRKPKISFDVRLTPDFYDGVIQKPLNAEWHGLLEIRVDNDGAAKANGVMINVLAPQAQKQFRWVLSSGEADSKGQAPDPIPAGEWPVVDVDGDARETQYLSQAIDLTKNSVTCLWVNLVVAPGVASIPFRVTANHEQIDGLLSQEFVVQVVPALDAASAS